MAVEINLKTVIVLTVFSAVKSTILKDGHLSTPNVTGSMKGFHDLSRRVTYPEKIWRGGEETFIHNGYRSDPETRSLTKRSEVVNCPVDYTRDSIYNNCILPCSQHNCINGKCDGRTECKCNDGYVKSRTNSFICHQKCRPCLPGECTKSQLCTCDKGYRLSSNQQTCEPICNDPHCDGKICVSPDRCYRSSTYYKFLFGQYCSRECGFGECVGLNTCECFNGYNKTKDGRCSDPICNEGCGHGKCVGPNTCECFKGYNKTKDGRCFNRICNKVCGFGKCVGPNTCECFKGYNKTKDGRCSDPICNEWCGHGKCVGPNTCECFSSYNKTKDGRHTYRIYKECKFSSCTGPDICTCHPGDEKPFENSTTCVPRCTRCHNGTCVGPEICRCHGGFVNPNGNNGTCVKRKSKSNHDVCPDSGCDCCPGWKGEPRNASHWCAITNRQNSTYTASERKDSIRTNNTIDCHRIMWDGPICKQECSDQLDNTSINFTGCFTDMGHRLIEIDSLCNRSVEKTFLEKNRILLIGTGIAILLIAVFICIIVAVKRRAETTDKIYSEPAEYVSNNYMVENDIYSQSSTV
ncbi:neurogenic locus notch homolog protein 1-like [Neodiprion virginianus]|uniref:neurogenic locus notch homolog protein 1-like n=1 Tax=Neodiprion virginianus TaxID=2961670 RepID=UPI001EE6B75C|nr:neurogenic locus notch homolog protein 1-like [Neodiprion virginianus]